LEALAEERARAVNAELSERAAAAVALAEKLQGRSAALEEENERLKKELAKVMSAHERAARERDEERAAREEAESIKASFESKIQSVDDVMADKDSVIERLDMEMEALASAQADMAARHADDMDAVFRELAGERAQVEALMAAKAALEKELRAMRVELKLARVENAELGKKSRELKAKATQAVLKIAVRDTTSGDLTLEVSRLQRRVQELEAEVSAKGDVEGDLKARGLEVAAHEARVRDLEGELMLLRKELFSAKAAAGMSADETAEALEKANGEVLNLMKQAAGLQHELADACKSRDALQQALYACEEKLAAVEAERARQDKLLEGLRDKARRCQELEMKLNEMREEKERLLDDKALWEKKEAEKQAAHRAKLNEIEEEMLRKSERRKALEALIASKDKALEEKMEAIQLLQHEVSGLKAVLAASEDDTKRLEAMQHQSSDEVRKEVLKLQADLRDAKKAAGEASSIAVYSKRLEEELAALKARMLEVRAELSAANDERDAAQREARESTRAAATAQEEFQAMKEAAERLREVHSSSNSGARDQLLEMENEVMRMTEELRLAKAAAAKAKHGGGGVDPEALETLKARLSHLEAELAALERRRAGEAAHAEAERREMAALRGALERMGDDGSITAARISELEALRAEKERLEFDLAAVRETEKRTRDAIKKATEDAAAAAAAAAAAFRCV